MVMLPPKLKRTWALSRVQAGTHSFYFIANSAPTQLRRCRLNIPAGAFRTRPSPFQPRPPAGNYWSTRPFEVAEVYLNPRVPIIKPDGTHKRNAQGEEIQIVVPDSDSGIFLRGQGKSQVNIWCWPVGSGEVYGYRMDPSMPPEVRAGVTPRLLADHDLGQWNTFEITMKGDRLWVKLNGKQVLENAQLPGIPARGPIALQHHGGQRNGEWTSPPALVQFRNISIKELED